MRDGHFRHPVAIQVGIAFCAIWLGAGLPASAQTDWGEANKAVGAIGGWRTYAKERGELPEGYPSLPSESEVLLPSEVLAAGVSFDSAARLAAWESRRHAERSAPLEPPTFSYARTSGEVDSSAEVGVHLPLGSWIQRSRPLAADDDTWGNVERRILEFQALRERLITYADAVSAKAELARAMDRLEVQSVLEELTQRQREIGAVPEFELLSMRIERSDAQEGEAIAREAALRAAERLALEMRKPLQDSQELQRRLPLELSLPERLPDLLDDGRLDLNLAREKLAQQETFVSRARSGVWLGGLEVGVLQERFDTGEVNSTVELSWRLPLGGDASRQVDLGERVLHEKSLLLTSLQQSAEREIREAIRAHGIAAERLLQSAQALSSAEAWMEEQVYRYSGMLIGPHDILRAAARFRQVQSRHIAAQRSAFVAAVDAHFVRTIPAQAIAPAQSAMPTSSQDATH